MAGIEKSVELYELIIARLEKSGVAPHQLEYYRECLDLIRTCSTAEEAELAMRNSPLYTKGGQALMLDKFVAYVKAMEYCGYDRAAGIYRDKYEEIKDNYVAAWDTSYTNEITKVMIEYQDRKSLFTDIAFAPINYLGASELPTDQGSRRRDDEKLKEDFAKLSAKGQDFFEMAKDPYLRELVPLNDRAYEEHIARLRRIAQAGTMAETEDEEEYRRIRSFISSNSDALRAAAEGAKTGKAVVMAVPNETAPEKYDFIDRAEEA